MNSLVVEPLVHCVFAGGCQVPVLAFVAYHIIKLCICVVIVSLYQQSPLPLGADTERLDLPSFKRRLTVSQLKVPFVQLHIFELGVLLAELFVVPNGL